MMEIEKIELSPLIAGPCSAESQAQVMECARSLAAQGVKIFRAGVWKPRTRPGNFEGAGLPALEWLKAVKAETGMAVTTEVANASHVEAAKLWLIIVRQITRFGPQTPLLDELSSIRFFMCWREPRLCL